MESWRDGRGGEIVRDGEVEKWKDRKMEKWKSGEIERWRSGELEVWERIDTQENIQRSMIQKKSAEKFAQKLTTFLPIHEKSLAITWQFCFLSRKKLCPRNFSNWTTTRC